MKREGMQCKTFNKQFNIIQTVYKHAKIHFVNKTILYISSFTPLFVQINTQHPLVQLRSNEKGQIKFRLSYNQDVNLLRKQDCGGQGKRGAELGQPQT